jgi:hypothetical protein
MQKKFRPHNKKNDYPSMNKGSHNTSQGEGSGKTGGHWQQGKKEESGKSGEYWQQGPKKGSRNANGNWQQRTNNGSGNANGNMDQIPDIGDLTRSGCLPTLFARIKAAFTRGAGGGCLPKLFILLLPILAVSVILFIGL